MCLFVDYNDIIKNGRLMLKPDWSSWDFNESDNRKKIAPPPTQKPYDKNAKAVQLNIIGKTSCGQAALPELLLKRHSTRGFCNNPISRVY